jgi:small subunit ribosomal protein S16
LEKTGDWQKFKGLPAPPPLLVAAPRADRKAIYEAEAKTAAGLAQAATSKPAKRADKGAGDKGAKAQAPATETSDTASEGVASADASAEG